MKTDRTARDLVPTIWGFTRLDRGSDGRPPGSRGRVDTILPSTLTAAELAAVQDFVLWRASRARRRACEVVTFLLVGLSLLVGVLSAPWWGVALAAPALLLVLSIVVSWGVDGWCGPRLSRSARLTLGNAIELRGEHLVPEPLREAGTREDPRLTSMRLLVRAMRDVEVLADELDPLESALARQMVWTALDPSVPHRISKTVVAAAYLTRVARQVVSDGPVRTATLDS
ncbi:hypothetical protein ACWFNS_14220 [Oerskovia enterophila]